MSEAIEALAEAWASLDGKLDEFHAGRAGEDTEGDYHGYLSDAAELAKRLEHRRCGIVRDLKRKPRKENRPRRSGAVAQGLRGKRAFRSRTIRGAEDSSHKGVHQR